MHITFINNDGGGFADPIPLEEGTDVATFLNDRLQAGFHPDRYIIKVNGEIASLRNKLRDGDRLSLTPAEMRGEAWRPKLKLFRQFLSSLGMAQERSGGKHPEVWKHPEGWSLPVKGSDSDRKVVDQACIRSLARNLNQSFGETLDAVHRVRVA